MSKMTPSKSFAIRLAMLCSALAAVPAEAQIVAELGVQQQRWLEDKGDFVSEDGFLPRATLSYQSQMAADAGWQAAIGGYAGDVAYRGSNQSNQTKLYSHSHYQGLELSVGGWQQLQPGWRVNAALAVARWRRDIYNPLQARDQSEIYRLALLQTGFSYAPTDRIELGAQLNYPLWARVEALLGDFGFERSPQLQPQGRLAPGLSLAWRPENDFVLRLQWSRLRFAASPAQAVGNSLVHQPASQLDMLLFGVARIF